MPADRNAPASREIAACWPCPSARNMSSSILARAASKIWPQRQWHRGFIYGVAGGADKGSICAAWRRPMSMYLCAISQYVCLPFVGARPASRRRVCAPSMKAAGVAFVGAFMPFVVHAPWPEARPSSHGGDVAVRHRRRPVIVCRLLPIA